ncbi:MAG: MerR family transcriptional regulator [Patulibacter minatonensis]
MRTVDLAARHRLSTQAIRNYERDGVLPVADRSPAGYRQFGARHDDALSAFLSLISAIGHQHARTVMRAVNEGELALALRTIDEAHERLLQDRGTLDASHAAVEMIRDLSAPDDAGPGRSLSIGHLSARLGVSPATLRKWERHGVLQPSRDYNTEHRRFAQSDIREADLAHLLRRGGHSLAAIAAAIGEVRAGRSTARMELALAHAGEQIDRRARAMLGASAALHHYLHEHVEGASS